MEKFVLRGKRLFYLDHHLRVIPHFTGVVRELRTCCDIFLIRESGAFSRSFFDQYTVPRVDITYYVVRGETYTEFIVFDFFYTSDFQCCFLLMYID